MTCRPFTKWDFGTCPCGRPLDMGVDHGDTETGDPICATCCPDCNPKGPEVDEPTYDITYTVDPVTEELTRREIEAAARGDLTLRDVSPRKREACRQWLKDNPAPLTKEQLDRLPAGTVIGTEDDYTHVKGADDFWWEISKREVLPTECTQIHYQPQGVFVPLTKTQIRAVEKRLVVQPNDQDAVNAAGRFVAACREAAE